MSEISEAIRRLNLPACFYEWSGLIEARTHKTIKAKGDSCLEEFLICENPECRFLTSLRQGDKLLRREDLVFSVCPNCDHNWSGLCPFCFHTLSVRWQGKVSWCTHCNTALLPEAHID
jgi:hypothetical protein